MHIIEIPDKKIKRYLPSDLSECDTRQYIEMSALMFFLQIGEIDYTSFRIHSIYKLLDMKRVKSISSKLDPESLSADDELKYSKIYLLSELIDSFFELNHENKRVLKQYFVNNPITQVKGGFRNYFGPADDFEDVTFGEYVDGLEAFINFNQTGEMIYLHQLFAIFYRKRKFFSKKRQKYIPTEIKERTEFFSKQPIGVSYGFYLLFESFQHCLADRKIFVQGNEIDLSIIFSGSKKQTSKLPGLGMKGILLTMAESGVYGDESGVRNTLLWEVLVKMYDITKRDLDQEAAFKKVK